MTPPITDTAAIYQLHGIRFAVPKGLDPVTNRYVFTDLPPGGHLSYDPYNEITLFADANRSPEEIISDVMEGLETSYDGPHLHNHRRTRVNGRVITQASITYTTSRGNTDTLENTVRIDYAFVPDEASGATWGFRLIPPDTSVTRDVSQDWVDILESVEPRTTTDIPLIGYRLENGTRYFYTHQYRVAIAERWRMVNDLSFAPMYDQGKYEGVNEIKRSMILLRSSILSDNSESQSIDDLKQSFSRFGLSGVVEERTISGRPVQWTRIDPRVEEGRVRTAYQRASIKTHETGGHHNHVRLNMEVEYVVDDPESPATPPSFVTQMREMHESMFHSIKFSD